MTFDPFGDFETEGYLRNFEKVKDLDIVKRLEHASFTTGIDEAFAQLAKPKQLGYEHVLQTHKILFDAVYPWAGQDQQRKLSDALTRELDTPGKGHLDNYLKPLMRAPIAYEQLAAEVARVPGFDGIADPQTQLNEVAGGTDEPAVKAQYEEVLRKRKQE